MDLPPRTPLRLNLGAGGRSFEGFLNVDLAGDPDILADVRALPLPDESVDEAIAIHVFEHLPRWDAERTLAEWFRVLKPGGLLVLELPDLLKCCRNVLDGLDDRAGLWGLYGDPVYRNELMNHRWGWSVDELRRALKKAGFTHSVEAIPQFHKKYRDMRIEATK